MLVGIGGDDPAHNAADVVCRLVACHAGTEFAEDIEEVGASMGEAPMISADGIEGEPRILTNARHGSDEAFGSNTDHSAGVTRDLDGFADDGGVAIETVFPERIADHG